MLIFIFILNLAISAWNAFACGKAWAETKSAGGWQHFMNWMGAIMSATGFSWCYLIALVFGAHSLGFLNEKYMVFSFEVGYVLLVPGLLFSGLMITIDSWAVAYRNGGVLNYGVAAYNTFAQVHNTMSAIEGFGPAIKGIFEVLGPKAESDDDDAPNVFIAFMLVVIALGAGALTTAAIITTVAGSQPLLSMDEMRQRQAA